MGLTCRTAVRKKNLPPARECTEAEIIYLCVLLLIAQGAHWALINLAVDQARHTSEEPPVLPPPIMCACSEKEETWLHRDTNCCRYAQGNGKPPQFIKQYTCGISSQSLVELVPVSILLRAYNV